MQISICSMAAVSSGLCGSPVANCGGGGGSGGGSGDGSGGAAKSRRLRDAGASRCSVWCFFVRCFVKNMRLIISHNSNCTPACPASAVVAACHDMMGVVASLANIVVVGVLSHESSRLMSESDASSLLDELDAVDGGGRGKDCSIWIIDFKSMAASGI